MKKQMQYLLTFGSVILLLLFVLFVINQTAGIVVMAKEYNPALGILLLYTLLLIYAAALVVPVVIYFTMPTVLRPPQDEQSPQFEAYLARLRNRLVRNALIAADGHALETRIDMENAIKILNARADRLTKSTASSIFVTTAISQNGRLDSIMVLIAQIRIIWDIAHIYNQRPSLREMLNLYVNVASTVFIAGAIEDLDIEEQVEPIITPLVSSSVIGGIPGAGGIATFMTTSIIDGAANALLTLRVGIITRRFFGLTCRADSREIRRMASLEAGGMLASIVVSSAGYVTNAILKASKKRAGAVGGSLKDAVIKSAESVTDVTRKSAQSVVERVKGKRREG